MPKDDRESRSVLKAEFAFLEHGGYRNMSCVPWRSPLVFQDSPTCLNFDRTKHPRSCHECVMTSLVPSDCLGNGFHAVTSH
jgi:hypothetical protein